MAKEIKFNVKLVVDGKEQLVTATTSVSELRANLETAKDKATRLRDTLITFNQSVETLRTVKDAVSQIAGTLNSVTEESRTFSGAMTEANTMAGKSSEDFEHLKDKVSELSKTIPVARDALAKGLYQVISNGVPEDNWVTFLEQSGKAAVGGLADLGETVKVTSTVIKNYELSWDAAKEVQDKIQLTAKNGVTSFEQLAQALPRVTGNAATLGVSIDELLATFATLTGVSGNTNEVATQMAAIFTALVKPSSEAGKMAEKMGIEFDAAAIKAAGGLQNFLKELDRNVMAYSQKSGMLKQEIYGKLFGSAESLRALGPLTGQLASKFNENVNAMKDSAGTIDEAFGMVGSSSAASLQLMKNKVGEATDFIASAMSGVMPYFNIASQVGNSVVAVLSLHRALTSLGTAQAVVKARTVAMNAATLLWKATAVRVNAVVQVMSASFRGAAVSACTLKRAIQGLMISTGVGIAIVALTEAVSAFFSKAENSKDAAKDAAEGMESMGEAADEVKTSYDSALKSTFSDLMGKYSKLKTGWKSLTTEQQKMAWIKQNQSAFNDLRLSIHSVSDAENIFNGKTDAVVEAFKQRALAAAYAAKLAKLYEKQIGLLDKKSTLEKEVGDLEEPIGGKTKGKFVVKENIDTRSDNTQVYNNNLRLEKAANTGKRAYNQKQLKDTNKELADINREIESTTKQLEEQNKIANQTIKPDKPSPSNTPTNGNNTQTEPKTYVEQLQEQLSAARKEMGNAMTVEARVKADAKIRDIQAQIDEVTKGKVSIEAEAEPTYITQGSTADKRKSRSNAQQRIDTIREDYEIGIIANKDEAKKRIGEINRQLKRLGLKPVEVHFKTFTEELHKQLQEAQREFDEAATVEAKVAAAAKITDIQQQIDTQTGGKLTIKADVQPTYIQQGSIEDKRQSYSNAQQKAARIQQDYEIGFIGYDEALRQIEKLNKEVSKLGGNIKPFELEVKVKDKGVIDAFGQIKEGWGHIQGIASGIQGITDALEGNGNAWEKTAALINGFISIVEGVKGVVELIQLLTVAIQAHSAATAVDTANTAANTASTAANTAVSAGNTAMKCGESIANATASGSKMPFPMNLVAIAAGVAAVIAAIAAIASFATGGVVGGTSTSGDRKFARVNSGEMILNKFQQTRLFQIINTPQYVPPVFTQRQLPRVETQLPQSALTGSLHLEIGLRSRMRGKDLEQTVANVHKIGNKSGRKFS